MTGEDLRNICALLGVKKYELAKYLGTTPETVSRWSQGASPIPHTVKIVLHKELQERGLAYEWDQPQQLPLV